MAVIGEFRVDVRPYTGYEDPSLPVAGWIAQAGIAGDASGGDVFIDFLMKRSADEQVSELFNLEQVSIDTTAASSISGIMETINMDTLAPNRPASTQRWGYSLTARLGITTALDLTSLTLPLWLGTPNRSEGNGGLRFQFDNVDLRLYAITIQGYMWGPRSVMAAGGPRRPVGGLYGTG